MLPTNSSLISKKKTPDFAKISDFLLRNTDAILLKYQGVLADTPEFVLPLPKKPSGPPVLPLFSAYISPFTRANRELRLLPEDVHVGEVRRTVEATNVTRSFLEIRRFLPRSYPQTPPSIGSDSRISHPGRHDPPFLPQQQIQTRKPRSRHTAPFRPGNSCDSRPLDPSRAQSSLWSNNTVLDLRAMRKKRQGAGNRLDLLLRLSLPLFPHRPLLNPRSLLRALPLFSLLARHATLDPYSALSLSTPTQTHTSHSSLGTTPSS